MKTKYTYDEQIFSDFYKDTHGFRPRGHIFFTTDSKDVKQEAWDHMMADREVAMEEHDKEIEAATADFESQLVLMVEAGCPDRAEAIRWIVDAFGEELKDESADYICFTLEIPYSFREEIYNAINGEK